MNRDYANMISNELCYRIVSIVRLPASAGKEIYNEAHLHHDQADFRVYWHSTFVDARLQCGRMVMLSGVQESQKWQTGGLLRVAGLILADNPLLSPLTCWKSLNCIAIAD